MTAHIRPARRPLLAQRFSIHLVRLFALLLCAGLAACAAPTVPPPQSSTPGSTLERRPVTGQADHSTRPLVGPYRASQLSGDYAGYQSVQQFVDTMVQRHGFDRAYLLGLFSQAKRKDWTLNYLAKSDQGMVKGGKPAPGGWSKYRAQFLDERHIGAGVEFARRHRAVLKRATRMYGVPEEYILGILAVETTFGSFTGNHRVIDALTTLSFDYARRGDFFRSELEQYLLMMRSEGMDPSQPKGSFAGAMGLGQFMPSSFRKWAVDFDGDGHRNLWDPEDAIGSVANYFAQHGWQPGQPVVTPLICNGNVSLETGFATKYSLTTLTQAGLKPASPCASQGTFSLLLLRFHNSDQYLVGHPNFYTITRYNNSTHYAMAVHELAQSFKQRL